MQSVGAGAGPADMAAPAFQNDADLGLGLYFLGEEVSAARRTSDESFVVNGADFSAESAASANFIPAGFPQSYAIVPGPGQGLAWARYSIAELTADRPVQLEVNVSQARAEEGGELLPLSYFIGMANFTGYHWKWWGPFTTDTQLSLNHPASELDAELTERFVSATGVLHFVVATGTASGSGDAAVQLDRAVITTSATYVWNKPHFVWFVETRVGSSLPKGAKTVSALKPEQFVTLDWNQVEAFGIQDIFNTANSYQLSRQGPNDSQRLELGQIYPPGVSFTDPLDLDAGVAEPIPGTTYSYFIYAQNTAGTTVPASTSITIPILPPAEVLASLDGEAAGFTLVSWSAVDGATGYEVWRGASPLAESSSLVSTLVDGEMNYADTEATPGELYWYFIRSVGLGDADEANGIEAGATSGYSLGAQGLRRVQLSLAGLEPPVTGFGLPADPYILLSSNSYQFKAFDQTGRELTILCLWETDPESAANFAGDTAGLLEGIQPTPNDFVARATFSFSSYSWVGSAHCSVQ